MTVPTLFGTVLFYLYHDAHILFLKKGVCAFMKSWKHLIAFRVCLLCFVLSCAVFIGCTVYSFSFLSETASTKTETSARTVILDAGHGDMDGGAVGKNSVLEKEINLLQPFTNIDD